MTTPNLDALLNKLDEICDPYMYKHSPEVHLVILRILDATMDAWLQPAALSTTFGRAARYYCWQIVNRVQQQDRRSWRVQDSSICFLDAYLTKDPKEEVWKIPVDNDCPKPEQLPTAILPSLGSDSDIRIRFRAAAISSRLFHVGRIAGRDLMKEVYTNVHGNLSADQDK